MEYYDSIDFEIDRYLLYYYNFPHLKNYKIVLNLGDIKKYYRLHNYAKNKIKNYKKKNNITILSSIIEENNIDNFWFNFHKF